MKVTVHRTKVITVKLSEWEAKDLHDMLVRIKVQHIVGKSEFSMRQKATGRHLLEELKGKL